MRATDNTYNVGLLIERYKDKKYLGHFWEEIKKHILWCFDNGIIFLLWGGTGLGKDFLFSVEGESILKDKKVLVCTPRLSTFNDNKSKYAPNHFKCVTGHDFKRAIEDKEDKIYTNYDAVVNHASKELLEDYIIIVDEADFLIRDANFRDRVCEKLYLLLHDKTILSTATPRGLEGLFPDLFRYRVEREEYQEKVAKNIKWNTATNSLDSIQREVLKLIKKKPDYLHKVRINDKELLREWYDYFKGELPEAVLVGGHSEDGDGSELQALNEGSHLTTQDILRLDFNGVDVALVTSYADAGASLFRKGKKGTINYYIPRKVQGDEFVEYHTPSPEEMIQSEGRDRAMHEGGTSYVWGTIKPRDEAERRDYYDRYKALNEIFSGMNKELLSSVYNMYSLYSNWGEEDLRKYYFENGISLWFEFEMLAKNDKVKKKRNYEEVVSTIKLDSPYFSSNAISLSQNGWGKYLTGENIDLSSGDKGEAAQAIKALKWLSDSDYTPELTFNSKGSITRAKLIGHYTIIKDIKENPEASNFLTKVIEDKKLVYSELKKLPNKFIEPIGKLLKSNGVVNRQHWEKNKSINLKEDNELYKYLTRILNNNNRNYE